jgi:hypothetical protein
MPKCNSTLPLISIYTNPQCSTEYEVTILRVRVLLLAPRASVHLVHSRAEYATDFDWKVNRSVLLQYGPKSGSPALVPC